ncbi:hypothetical protein TNCV_1348941 [Trichonephila clavipes]|nr:hypothetical protein TNCV_1348941 [Trichonephila clavipes]
MKQQRRYNFTISIRTHKDIKDKREAAIRGRGGDKKANSDYYMVKASRQRERAQKYSPFIPGSEDSINSL